MESAHKTRMVDVTGATSCAALGVCLEWSYTAAERQGGESFMNQPTRNGP